MILFIMEFFELSLKLAQLNNIPITYLCECGNIFVKQSLTILYEKFITTNDFSCDLCQRKTALLNNFNCFIKDTTYSIIITARHNGIYIYNDKQDKFEFICNCYSLDEINKWYLEMIHEIII